MMCVAVTESPETVPCAPMMSPTWISETEIVSIFVTLEDEPSIVYVVPFFPVTVMVLPFTAVTVPCTPGPRPSGPPMPPPCPPKPPTPSSTFVAVIVVPLTVPCTIKVSPTAMSDAVIVVSVGGVQVREVPVLVVPVVELEAVGAERLVIVALETSIVYVVPDFLSVRVTVFPSTAVTVPTAAGGVCVPPGP